MLCLGRIDEALTEEGRKRARCRGDETAILDYRALRGSENIL